MSKWNQAIAQLPSAHFLQTEQWAKIKQSVGWAPYFPYWDQNLELRFFPRDKSISPGLSAAALVLERKIQIGSLKSGLSMFYCPKGPIFSGTIESGKAVLEQLQKFAKQKRAIFIKIDPDIILGTGDEKLQSCENEEGQSFKKYLQDSGWIFSPDQVQFRNTIQIDLKLDLNMLLSSMKQKTRYNIRLAGKKGIRIRPGTSKDLSVLYAMYAETALRDHFVLRDQKYYLHVWDMFMENQMAEPLIAELHGEPVAAVIVFRFANKAWYVYGMSREIHREKMPNYLLQWHAISRAKEAGCSVYDFWGAPNLFTEDDPLWRVYRFKEGFGGQIIRTIGAWDYALKPNLYRFSMFLLPKLLGFLRRKAKKELALMVQT